MKLFLLSHTIDEYLKPKFERFIGRGTQGLKVAFVHTGANSADFDWDWKKEDYEPLVKKYDFQMELIDIAKLQGEELESKLRRFDVIWMNGGATGYLARKVRESGMEEFLPELLESGIVYIGSSAGSMVCSGSLEIAEWYIGEPEPGAAKIEGLGYIDFQIYPHYKDGLLDEIKKNKPKGQRYFLLRDGQAISVEEGVYTLHGEDIILLE